MKEYLVNITSLLVAAVCLVVSFIFLVQPEGLGALPVTPLLYVLYGCSVAGVFLYTQRYQKSSSRRDISYSPDMSGTGLSVIAVSLLGLMVSTLMSGLSKDAERHTRSITALAPTSTYANLERSLSANPTLAQWTRVEKDVRRLETATAKGVEALQMILSIQGASESPEWQARLEHLAREGVIFEEDVLWLVTHLQEEVRQGRGVQPQALALLSSR